MLKRFAFRSFLLASAAVALMAQVPPPYREPETPDPHPFKLSVETTLVLIPVTVTDATNHFVLGLTKDNFTLLENGKRQNVKNLSGEDAPLSVGLLVDLSGSMTMKLDISRQAVTEFLRTMNPQDEAFLVDFSDRANLSVPFTHKFSQIESKLGTMESQGLTALIDAVHLGLDEMKKSHNPRKALLIISDGGDNNSQYTAKEVEELVRLADVQVYSMGVFERLPYRIPALEEISGPHLLSELSEQTGGRVFSASRASVLPGIARQIGVELRNQYVLAYTPSDEERNGKYRRVEVQLSTPEGLSALKARWRTGYYAPRQ